MMTFRKTYFFLTILLLLTEILIAVFVKDRFIRPYFGDYLVVILIYCFLRAFFSISVTAAAIAVLLFSCIIEITQYFHLVEHLGLRESKVARAILGWSFAWSDLVAYTLGIITVLLMEKLFGARRGFRTAG